MTLFACSVLAIPQSAHAETGVVLASSNPQSGGPGSTSVDGTDFADTVTVRFQASPTPSTSNGHYVISDPAGVSAGSNCAAASATEVICEQFSGADFADVFVAVLGSGNDEFRFGGDFHGTKIYAGLGNDQILGGSARDAIFGEDGQDSLRGRGGNDRIDAGSGRDGLLGGPGNDRLYAADGEADKQIRCGPGHDVAEIDHGIDPRPIGCERID